jgi:hypothetical protein
LRRQVTAAMIFNGHTENTIDEINEEIFSEITVMYADGMLGNRGQFDSLAPLTAGVFNYMRSNGQTAYKQDSIFPWINQYFENPDHQPTKQQEVNNSLLTFMSQAQGFSIERFKK